MCQSVNLFCKIAVQNVGCVSSFFMVDATVIYGYNFVVPLNTFIKPFEAPQGSAEIKISVNFSFNTTL